MIKDITKAEIFTIKSNEIVGRFDPQAYSFEIKKAKEKTESISFPLQKLKEVAIFRKEIVEKSDEVYIGLKNIESKTGIYIKNNEKEIFSTASKFYKNDVIFPKLRPYLNKVHYAIFDGICSTEFYVLNSKKVNNKFLFIFLNSDIILNQTKNLMTGNTLPRLQTKDVENLKIPIPPLEIQEKIIDLMDKAYKLKKGNEEKAKNLITSIDNFVLEKLEIKIPELKDEMTFTISSKKIENNRIDSEFHQEKYRQIEKAMENGKYELKKVEELIDLRANENFSLNENKIYEYLDISNIDNKEFKILNYQKELNENLPNSPKKKIENGDFLFSKVRTYLKNICLFSDENDENKISTSAIFIFRKNKEFSNYLFSLFLTNLITKYLEKFDSGSTYPTIKDEDILNLKIPLPPLEIQKEISKEVKERLEKAKRLKKEAEESLEKAKKEVEKILLEK